MNYKKNPKLNSTQFSGWYLNLKYIFTCWSHTPTSNEQNGKPGKTWFYFKASTLEDVSSDVGSKDKKRNNNNSTWVSRCYFFVLLFWSHFISGCSDGWTTFLWCWALVGHLQILGSVCFWPATCHHTCWTHTYTHTHTDRNLVFTQRWSLWC